MCAKVYKGFGQTATFTLK